MEQDAERLGLPVACLGSCSFNEESDLGEFEWGESYLFSKFYQLDLLRARVLKWFKALEGTPILALDHSNDPDFDSSGSTGKTQYTICLSNFNSIREICWLYNGSSSPTFESGCGLSHSTYEDDLREMVLKFILNPFNISDKENFAKEHFSLDNLDDDKMCEFSDIVVDSLVEHYLVESFKQLKLN